MQTNNIILSVLIVIILVLARSANRALMTSRSSVKLRARLNIHSSRFHSKKKLEKLEFKKKFKIK